MKCGLAAANTGPSADYIPGGPYTQCPCMRFSRKQENSSK